MISNTCKSIRRVVITGMGAVTPLGSNIQQNWENLIQGEIAIRDLSGENYAESLPKSCKIAATIKDFDKTKYKTLVISHVTLGDR